MNAELERVINDLKSGASIVTPDNAEALLRFVFQLGFFDGRVDGIKYATDASIAEIDQLIEKMEGGL
jgi:hypothetical protein